jgi:hypothetical protein
MTGRRLLVLASVATLLPVAFASGAPGGHGRTAGGATKRPRIRGGRYGVGDTYLDVNVARRTAFFHFTLYCDDLYSDQYVTSGPTPVRGELTGVRRGATVRVEGEYSGPAASGPGTQIAFWSMSGRFTRPTHFEGRVEYEAATSPAPPRARAQCIDAKSIHLDRQPTG